MCIYHCADCSYDVCFVCSLPVPSTAALAKMNIASASPGQLSQPLQLPCSPFATLAPSSETLQALDRVVCMAREYIDSADIAANGSALMNILETISSKQGGFIGGIAKRRQRQQAGGVDKSLAVSENVTLTVRSQDLAVSAMFAVAVLKESLGALLEVAFLLADEDILSSTDINYCSPSLCRPDVKAAVELPSKQLHIGQLVKEYADRLFSSTTLKGSNTATLIGTLSSELFFSDTEAGREDAFSLFEATNWHCDPYLTCGDKQAIDILYAAAEISGGLKAAFAIDDDAYFDVLVCMVERGVALLHQAAVCHQSGDRVGYETVINNRRSRKSIYFASASLKIIYFGLQRLSAERKASGNFSKTILDVKCLSDSLIHPDELIPIERESASLAPRTPLGVLPAVVDSTLTANLSSETIDDTYRSRLCQIIDLLVSNPLLQPDTSFIGQSAVLYAGMFDLLRPRASDQFAVICSLLEKSDSSVETPCERALVISLMGGMEGPKLLELITPTVSRDGDVDSSEEGDVEKFVRSILMLADRSLSSKIRKIVDAPKPRTSSHDAGTAAKFSLAPVGDGSAQLTPEDVGEGILKVLEPTTIQTFCNLCHCVAQSSEEGNEKNLSHYQSKLIELLVHLLSSAKSTIEQLVVNFDAFESRCAVESEGSFESKLLDMYRKLDDQMKRSHVANLVPLVLFGTTLLWRHLISSGRRIQAKCLVNLFEPLHLISKSLAPFMSFEKRFRPSLNADPENEPTNIEPVKLSVPSVANWDPSLSNSNLEFTEDNLTCRRPGSASCYPAAFASFPANKCSFSVSLSETLSTTNWLTIGVCTSGFATSSSDGFGRSSNSW